MTNWLKGALEIALFFFATTQPPRLQGHWKLKRQDWSNLLIDWDFWTKSNGKRMTPAD